MSRSYRHTPICSVTKSGYRTSEALDKKQWHSRFRSNSKQHLANCKDYENFLDYHFRQCSNPWSMNKDGKLTFDPKDNPKLMRK